MRFSDLDPSLAVELKQEMAARYFAESKKMVDSLNALKDFDRTHPSATLTQKQISRRFELVELAGERVHFLIIQREALHLPVGDQFFQDYEIPDEVKTSLGPRRQK